MLFNDKKHSEDMGNNEIKRYLSNLAVNRQVSAATQNQVLCANIFLYRYIVNRDITDLRYSFTKLEKAMPTLLTHEEATAIISKSTSTQKLVASILYGCGFAKRQMIVGYNARRKVDYHLFV
ncbi:MULTISPECIES: phage integrase N-terminal SAM-like domain-containing protein [unclassified Colwellia]|uniref:phage integrase N-terminal SAM-like domain-containing protein n=1 Tax=unclassified Colwellia TaxID=196834 RepID=UPI003855C9EA